MPWLLHIKPIWKSLSIAVQIPGEFGYHICHHTDLIWNYNSLSDGGSIFKCKLTELVPEHWLVKELLESLLLPVEILNVCTEKMSEVDTGFVELLLRGRHLLQDGGGEEGGGGEVDPSPHYRRPAPVDLQPPAALPAIHHRLKLVHSRLDEQVSAVLGRTVHLERPPRVTHRHPEAAPDDVSRQVTPGQLVQHLATHHLVHVPRHQHRLLREEPQVSKHGHDSAHSGVRLVKLCLPGR